jgi:hypothetical protein
MEHLRYAVQIGYLEADRIVGPFDSYAQAAEWVNGNRSDLWRVVVIAPMETPADHVDPDKELTVDHQFGWNYQW